MKNFRNSFIAEDFPKKELPDKHREEFLQKLRENKKHRGISKKLLLVAAVFMLLIGLGFVLQQNYNAKVEVKEADNFAVELQKIEVEYLADINAEWKKFMALAKDDKLKQRYKEKLEQLDADYKEISIEFNTDKNNLLVVEDLIRNLQIRLSLLKDIQKHIKILNKKNKQNETSI